MGALLGVIGPLVCVGGLMVVGYQILIYLKSGEWMPISVIDLMAKYFENAWAQNPDEWIGLHAMLASIPLSVAVIVLGFILTVAGGVTE